MRLEARVHIASSAIRELAGYRIPSAGYRLITTYTPGDLPPSEPSLYRPGFLNPVRFLCWPAGLLISLPVLGGGFFFGAIAAGICG